MLSGTDLQVLALTYEVECERVGGKAEFQRIWKTKEEEKAKAAAERLARRKEEEGKRPDVPKVEEMATQGDAAVDTAASVEVAEEGQAEDDGWTTISKSKNKRKSAPPRPKPQPPALEASSSATEEVVENDPEIALSDEDSDEDDWITPDNLSHHLIQDTVGALDNDSSPKTQITAACCTTDFAMQNVLLQLHIHLFSPTTMTRIKSVRSQVLRCHACFKISRDMTRQFCPSCGQPAMNKVTCSTDENGVFRIHLKRNWQWNNRGNVYSYSKPQHGTASMKGVRENVVLSEDQKEYERAMRASKRFKERDLMDIDYLPGLLTGERLGHGGNPRVGAGRNVNASKKTRK